jgi:transposase-like protein
MRGTFNKDIFQDEIKAREWLETELWPEGPVCPHCGVLGRGTRVQGKSARPGLVMCNECRKQYTVTVGTLYERSHVPLNKWLFAVYLMMASKKGMSAHQIHRMIGVSYKTAWFMCHRIREGLREGKFPGPLGGENKVVEADETYVGGKETNKHKSKRTAGRQGGKGKEAVFSLVERDGKVRSRHVPEVTAKTLREAIVTQVDRKSHLMTDEAGVYTKTGEEFAGHSTVNHSIEEYVRHGGFTHTNTIEGYLSILKRGVYGTYHHVSAAHLKRYLCEFDFRYNERSKLGVSDVERFAKAMQGIVGKRLTYRRTGLEANG